MLRRVEHLPERARIILEFRFGLLDGVARTLADVGRYFGLTPERIRQLERSGILMFGFTSAEAFIESVRAEARQ